MWIRGLFLTSITLISTACYLAGGIVAGLLVIGLGLFGFALAEATKP